MVLPGSLLLQGQRSGAAAAAACLSLSRACLSFSFARDSDGQSHQLRYQAYTPTYGLS